MRTRFLLLSAVLISCSGSTNDSMGHDLSGRVFVSESLEGRELVPGTEVRVSFDKEISADAGCNTLSGDYHFDGNVLVVTSLGGTAIGCDNARFEQDDWLAKFLLARPKAELVEPRLTLSSQTETMTLLDREIQSPDRPLVGTQWFGNGMGDGQAVRFGPGSDLVTVVFGADGHVEAFSACQHGSGSFVADATTISFTDLAYDGAACPDPTLEKSSQDFLAVLDGSDVSFAIEERSLTIEHGVSTLYFLAAE